jgi:hypothetical protein
MFDKENWFNLGETKDKQPLFIKRSFIYKELDLKLNLDCHVVVCNHGGPFLVLFQNKIRIFAQHGKLIHQFIWTKEEIHLATFTSSCKIIFITKFFLFFKQQVWGVL